MSELGYFFYKSSLHIIAGDLDVKDRSCSMMIKLNDVKSCNTVRICYYDIMLTTVKARVFNKPYIQY